MKPVALILASILVISSNMTSSKNKVANATSNDLIIQNITVISSERNVPLDHAFVRVRLGRIVELSTTKIVPDKNDRVVDGWGKYLIPGLMDSHVHLKYMPGIAFGDNGPLNSLKYLQKSFEVQQPRSYLYHGFTQLLDTAASPGSLKIFNQQALKPEVFFCGATPIIGGYPTVFSNNDELSMHQFPYFVNQQIAGESLSKEVDLSLHTPEKVIPQMKKDGAICNKIHIEDGFGEKTGWPMLSNENITRLQSEAHKNQLKQIAHANAFDMQLIAEKQNVDVIAHGMWNWTGHTGEKTIPDEIKALLDRIINKNIAFQPTSSVMIGLRDTTAGIDIDTPAYRNVTPKTLMEYYASEKGRWFQKEMIKEFGDLPADKRYEIQTMISEQGDKVIKYLAENGGTILLASDTPSSPVYVSQPGLTSYQEMVHLAHIGIPLKMILASATINNAKAFDLDDDYGTIETGKIANLLILNENPLESVSAYDEIDKIILRGKIIPRNSLKAN